MEDCFSNTPRYIKAMLRRRFHMRKYIFLCIVNKLEETDEYFQQHPDAIGELGASALQKCTAAIWILTYGVAYDQVDEYLKLATSTTKESAEHFVSGVTNKFGDEYLRRPNVADVKCLFLDDEHRSFLG